jgi:hypothetical protein
VRAAIATDPRRRRRFVIDAAGLVMRRVVAVAPRDTARFVRAFCQASNQAGLGPMSEPALVASRHAARIFELISSQHEAAVLRVKKLEKHKEAWYPGGPPKRSRTGYYRELVKKIEAAKKKALRTRTELHRLEEGGDATLMMGFLSGQTQRGRSMLTVRHKVYGGVGRVISMNGATIVEIINREPHARLVERRTGVLRYAASVVRGALGLKVYTAAYLARLAADTGMQTRK